GAWLFDEGKGDVAGDISGNKNDGKITGAKWGEGKFGKALDFDGVDDKVDIPDNPILNKLDEITIMSWVYLRREVTSGTWNAVAGKNPYPNGYLIWIQVPREPCGLVYAGGTRFDNRTGVQIELKRWYHLAFTRDVKGEMKFYIDGVLSKVAASTAGAISINAGPLAIAGQSPQTLDGFIDEVIFFSTVLSGDDIKSIAARGLSGATAVTNSGKLVTTWADIRK
ncbi:LamG domain-containing protein, partial [Candidatus Poribacteria bacterium]|nr:LamG domain-containing protein [Candidatus Poribacteria bacterium]